MNAGKPKILFCTILHAMIFHEDELISLNNPQNLLTIFSYIVIETNSTVEIRSSGHVADTQVIIMIWLWVYFFRLFCFLWRPQRKHYIKIFITCRFQGPCSFSLCWHLIKLMLCAVTERALFLHFFRNTWKSGNFRRGWIYNFILTWLILHREVFVQEAACLIMVQLCLTESKHDAKGCQ